MQVAAPIIYTWHTRVMAREMRETRLQSIEPRITVGLHAIGPTHAAIRAVNVGAGAVTCNFDGVSKHRTVIEDGVFVGTNSTLVAPLIIHRDAYVGAGSTVTVDVPEGALALGRARQRNVPGWRARRGEPPAEPSR